MTTKRKEMKTNYAQKRVSATSSSNWLRLCMAVLISLLVLPQAFAQSGGSQLTGIVSDQSGDPLAGAFVVVAGTQTGTMTDLDGSYSIKVEKGRTVEFSFLGYKTQNLERSGETQCNYGA